MSSKAYKGLVAGILNKVPDLKAKWLFVGGDSWEFGSDVLAKDLTPSIPWFCRVYNEALTTCTTKVKFNDQVKVVLSINK